MKKIITSIVLLGLLIAGCVSKQNLVVVRGTDHEMDCYLPAQWEERLDHGNKWLLPPPGERFVWIYCVRKSLVAEPHALKRTDFQLHYTLGGTDLYTTTLVARGNNDIYMWALDQDPIQGGSRNYGGVTDADGFGDRYVFAVPENAQDFVLEVTSIPPVPLSIR